MLPAFFMCQFVSTDFPANFRKPLYTGTPGRIRTCDSRIRSFIFFFYLLIFRHL